MAVAAFMGKLSKAASAAVKTIVDEASLPNSLKSIPMVVLQHAEEGGATGDDGASAAPASLPSEHLYFHQGLLLRVVQGASTSLLGSSSAAGAGASGAATPGRRGGAGPSFTGASGSGSVEGWRVLDFGGPDMVQRKVVGHEMRGLRIMTECSALVRGGGVGSVLWVGAL
mgnify:CR=1 FL=1